ncbi:MAG: hypothetical protein ACRD3V_11870 [Vicinamibacteria bacterium]
MTDQAERATEALTKIRLTAGPEAARAAHEQAQAAGLEAARRVRDETLIELADALDDEEYDDA